MFNNARTEARRGALAGGGDQADSNGTTKRGVQAGSFPSFVFTAASRRGAFRSDTGGAVESRLPRFSKNWQLPLQARLRGCKIKSKPREGGKETRT